MLQFWVFLVIGTSFASASLEGLHFNSGTEYASSYDNYQPRDYHFDYAVSDYHTGDHKSQWEVKEKGVVRGSYSLVEPDGSTRVVDYLADGHGFRAVVKRIVHGVVQHVESHGGGIEGHGEEPLLPVQLESSPIIPIHHAYDGRVDNYVDNLLPESISYRHPIEEPLKLIINPHEEIKAHNIPTISAHGYGWPEPKLESIPIQLPQKDIIFESPKEHIIHAPLQHIIEAPHIQLPQKGIIFESPKEHIIHAPLQHIIEVPHQEHVIEAPLQIQNYHHIPQAISSVGHLELDIPEKRVQDEHTKIKHPHGVSSTRFYGQTNNPYGELEYGPEAHLQSEPSPLKIASLPYSFVVSHPVLKW